MKTKGLVIALILAFIAPCLALEDSASEGTSITYERTSIAPHGIIHENLSTVATDRIIQENPSVTAPVGIIHENISAEPILQVTSSSETGAFRVAPVVKIRPVNDVIKKDTPGLIEFYFSNPSLNDISLTADVYVSIPSGIHVSGEGFSVGGAAGDVHGNFIVPPGSDRTVYMEIIGDKLGQAMVHTEVIYYPQNNKDNFQQLSLTHPFTIGPQDNLVGLENRLDLTWIVLVVVVLGGVAIIYAIRRRSIIKIEDE